MTEDVIKVLPEPLQKFTCTLRKASYDDANKAYMCESKMIVINYDRMPNFYAKGKGWKYVPKSNDALYIDVNGVWHFIEFKNGQVQKDDIYRKIYDSIIMLIELNIIPDFDFVRDNINYILVYNSEKINVPDESPAREDTYGYILSLAKQEKKLFGIEQFEKYLFNEVHTYSKQMFEDNFVAIKEKEESLMS